ncbi:MAG TPA: GAF domain-containing protein, partial [Acidimicrobiales bacterium]|nr:GAF domain-containing protein [Acidimicrobiales bacterium]
MSCIALEEGLRPLPADDIDPAVDVVPDVIEALPDAVIVTDESLQIRLVNRTARQLLATEDLSGRGLPELFPRAGHAARVTDAVRVGATGPLRLPVLTDEGEEVEVELHLGRMGRLVVASLRALGDLGALERLAGTARYIQAVLDAAQQLQQATDVTSVLDDVLPALCRRLDWELAAVWMTSEGGAALRCTTTWQAPDTDIAGWEDLCTEVRLGTGDGMVGATWRSGTTRLTDDVVADMDDARAPAALAARLHGAVTFPLVGRDGVRGVVELLSRGTPPTSPELGDLLTTVGRQAGMFLDRLEDQESARRREEELRYRAALLSAQIDAAPQAVLAVSKDRTVLAANHKFEDLWRLPRGTVKTGQPSPALQGPTLVQVQDPAAFEAALRWGHEHPTQSQSLDVPLMDGRIIHGEAAPIVDEDGEYHGRVWFLTDDTERRRADAERTQLVQQLQQAQRSQSFLLQASRVLAATSGYAESLERLAAVAVPTLGDICLIDVVQDGGVLRRMAARHADSRMQPLVDELGRRFGPEAGGVHPSAMVVQSRHSRWSAEMTDEFLRATCRDEEHFAIVKELGFTSYMTVPLVAGEAVLGTLTLVSAGSGRRFGPDDLALAEDLAGQVAQVAAKAHRYEREHRVAHTLQASLLPTDIPEVAGVRFALRYSASPRAAEVGGDWFDVMTLPSGAVRVAVGDVAGHDTGA